VRWRHRVQANVASFANSFPVLSESSDLSTFRFCEADADASAQEIGVVQWLLLGRFRLALGRQQIR
jgi:hypothetical protein